MNYREKMREYLKEPDEYSSQYGKWGDLNREQRQMITRLLNEMDNADEVIKHQFFEIERLQAELDKTRLSELDKEHTIDSNIKSYNKLSKYSAELEDRIDKALEYIELGINMDSIGVARTKRKLLNILQGRDKDE